MIKDKHYFVADTHLGVPNYEESLIREKALVRFLLEAEKDAKAIYLLGDIFDFWHEYKLVVPKFYVRLLGTLASIVDRGTEVHFFTGNHDQWIGDYFEKEIGMIVHKEEIIKDYLLTNVFTKKKAEYQRAYLRNECEIKNETLINSVGILAGVRENFIRAAFDYIDQNYNGMDAYLHNEMQFTDERIEDRRDNYLE